VKTIIYALAILAVAGYSSAFAADGYATINGTTTGGQDGPTVTVTNLADFLKYVGTNIPYNVQLQGSISSPTNINVKSDKTILGLGTNATINGTVYLSGASNVVVRNLFITNPSDDDGDGTDDEDGITVVNTAHHVWIDHCTFYDCLDGEADITKASDFVTVSWCKFLYTTNSGHNFVNLIGGDDGDTGDRGRLHVTFHHNWWSTLCHERMPRVRFGRIHSYNNYFNAPGNNYCIRAALESEVLVENNHFQNVKTPWEIYVTIGVTGKVYAVSNVFVNVTYQTDPGTDTVFTPPYSYTMDETNVVAGIVTNNAGAGRLPVAGFTASPTIGTAPLAVTFTDSSTGIITDRFWSFGDGTTTNTIVTSLTHTYTNFASFGVSLTVSGPAGTNTLNRIGYITVTNALPPVITAGLTVTNAPLQVGSVAVVVAGDTNVFSVVATNLEPGTLSYQWSFGDGVTNAWSSSGTAEHAYSTTNCGPYVASVTVSNGQASISSNFTVTVACQLNITKLQPKLNFAKTNADRCTVRGAFDLPAGYSFSNKLATLDIGGAEVSFTLDSKGRGRNGLSTFSKPTYNRKTSLWTLNATLKNGSWRTPWAAYSMINSNIPKPGALVTNMPVIFLLDTEAFMGTTNLHYTAKQGKSGTAK
jgi:pectate lyase